MIKKSLSILLANLLLMTLVYISPANADFPDVPSSHPNSQAIDFLKSRGIISGSDDGNFYPDRVVNRAEFLKMVLLSADISSRNTLQSKFPDVNRGEWFHDFVTEASERGVVQGYPDGSFQPGREVNKVEALKMLLLAHDINSSAPNSDVYVDVKSGDWFAPFVSYAAEKNLIDYSGNRFYPSEGMTRANLSEIIYRMITIQEDPELEYFQEDKGKSTVRITDGVRHSIPLNAVVAGGPPKDGIPSIDDPKFVSVSKGIELYRDSGLGIAVEFDGIHRFYPNQVLVWHEIVNDMVGTQPALITYCPLCGTGIVFDPTVNGRATEFGTSGKLWNSNLLMYDRRTDSYWSQVLGEAVVGEFTGTKLKKLPYDNMTFGDWRRKFPNGKVLSTDTGEQRDYNRDPYGNYYENSTVYFRLDNEDDRYHNKEETFGIEINDQYKVYPVSELNNAPSVFNDSLGGVNLVIKWNDDLNTIDIRDENGEEIVPTFGFWFSWISVHPETEVYTAP